MASPSSSVSDYAGPTHLYTISPSTTLPSLPSTLNDTLHAHNQLATNWSYRQYMQHNGTQIMKQDTMTFYQSAGLSPYTFAQTPAQVVKEPIYTTSIYDRTASAMAPFKDSDLKRDYLDKVQFQARKVAPVMWAETPTERHYEKGFARVKPSV
jgi:hypothetical protein